MSSLNKVGKELVLELLNRDNEKNFTFADLVFHEPVAMVVPQGIRNTKLLVSATPGSNFRGTVEFMYWRLDLNVIIAPEDRIYPGQDITTSQQLVDLINARYELAMDYNDIVIEPIDTTTLPMEYTVRARSGSYGYIGQVTLTLTDSLVPLDKVVKKINIEDYLSSVIIANSYGNLHWSQGGRLPIVGGPFDHNIAEQNNTELELFMGVSVSNGTQYTDECIRDQSGMIDIVLEPNQGWDVWFGAGIIDGSRLAINKGLVDAYDITLDITWTGTTYTLTYVYDEAAARFGWVSSKPGLNPSPTVYFTQGKMAQQSFFRAKDFLMDLFDHKPNATDWGVTGTFDLTLRATPRQAVYLKPFTLPLIVSVGLPA